MSYLPLYNVLPEIADRETRVMTIQNSNSRLPSGSYALVEMYCDDVNCDCRRVVLYVISPPRFKDPVAIIVYGWESVDFYMNKFTDTRKRKSGEYDARLVEEMKGPCLNSFSPQSKYAPEILKLVKEYAINDDIYVDRLKEHYRLFRSKLEKRDQKKPGRNDPCICGSGKKYKKCCYGL